MEAKNLEKNGKTHEKKEKNRKVLNFLKIEKNCQWWSQQNCGIRGYKCSFSHKNLKKEALLTHIKINISRILEK